MKNKTFWFLIFFFSIIVLILTVGIFTSKEKKLQKETVTIDKQDFIGIYECGYLSGEVNALKSKSIEESKIRWQKDSAEIVKIYFIK